LNKLWDYCHDSSIYFQINRINLDCHLDGADACADIGWPWRTWPQWRALGFAFIDRFVTNEPLLQAQVEVESGALKAPAKFRAEIGDYKIDDPAMLQKLSTPGEHPLVITVIAGKDSDLLDAVLLVPASLAVDDHHFHWEWWALGAFATLVLLGIAVGRLRNQRQRRYSLGGQL